MSDKNDWPGTMCEEIALSTVGRNVDMYVKVDMIFYSFFKRSNFQNEIPNSIVSANAKPTIPVVIVLRSKPYSFSPLLIK